MKINEKFIKKILTDFIREELRKFHFKKGVLGLSGGLDSAIVAFLAASAMGPENIIGIIMPYGTAFHSDVDDAQNVVKELGIVVHTVDITESIDGYFTKFPTENKVLKGNKMARERMSILYDFSAREKALILGTSNKTELLLGYGTIHGDMACALNPIGDLYKSQVRQMGHYLGVPPNILKKSPTAGLWAGQTDEKELGITYEEIDKILFQLVDNRKQKAEVIASGFKKNHVKKIIQLIKTSGFKRKMPPIAKISNRSIGHDFLFPYDWDK